MCQRRGPTAIKIPTRLGGRSQITPVTVPLQEKLRRGLLTRASSDSSRSFSPFVLRAATALHTRGDDARAISLLVFFTSSGLTPPGRPKESRHLSVEDLPQL
ncbi:hypothetical protein MRX96_050411 [Rhipicephalus microplus]